MDETGVVAATIFGLVTVALVATGVGGSSVDAVRFQVEMQTMAMLPAKMAAGMMRERGFIG